MNDPVPISVLVLTYNEQINLAACLASVVGWADQIVVVDSFSTDDTVPLARTFGAEVVQHEFLYPAQQKNWALSNLALRNEWLLMLDADERVPVTLRNEISEVVAQDGWGCDGFWLRYRLIFYGKWIRHCGWYPTWILRLVRRGKSRWENRPVDEHAILAGRAGRLQNDLIHESLRDTAFWIEKHNRYSTANANIYFDLLRSGASDGVRPRLMGTQAERKRFIKQRIWPHLPARSLFFFLYLYVVRLGFLDGVHGFRFCLMHAIFQEFTSMKLWELKYYKEGAPEGGISVPVLRAAPSEMDHVRK